MSSSSNVRSPYIVSLPVDFLLVGGGSILLFLLVPWLYAGPMTPRLVTASLALTWLGNWPHNSATIYRLYGSRDVWKRYPLTAIVVPFFIVIAIVASFAAPQTVAPYFVKLALAWVLYHYCGQSIGVSLLYARRAEYTPTRRERWLLCAFFYGTFFCRALWSETDAAALRYFGVLYPRFGVPVYFSYIAAAWTYASAAGFLYYLVRNSVRQKRWPPVMYLLPAVTQYVWFFVAGMQPAWVELVPFFHGLQYLTIAWAMQVKSDADRRGVHIRSAEVGWSTLRWYGTNLVLGGATFVAAPWLVAKLAHADRIFVTAILFTALQVHHSFVDGVIWKLRAKSVRAPLMTQATTSAEPFPALQVAA